MLIYFLVPRFGRKTIENWHIEEIGQPVKVGKVKGTPEGGMDVMFPTTHDISPNSLDVCLQTLQNILESGNTVLITSKPHFDCIRHICAVFHPHNRGGTNQIMFRFSIGAMNNFILGYWDRDAPKFQERLDALKLAHDEGFRTSISVEPCLDTANVVNMFYALKPHVTNSIWIGKMNKVRHRVMIVTEEDEHMVRLIEEGQTDEWVKKIYEALKEEVLVRWKESYKQVLGLPLAEEEGADA